MAYLSGFEYDIFISYAHVNNQRVEEDEDGWVGQFQKHLDVQLSQLVGRMGVIKIWWDPSLDGNQLFNRTIQERVNRSAVFLALTSKGYLASDYCQQELSWFVQKATTEPYGLSIGDRVRIFNLLLNNIPHTAWPEAYSGTSGHIFHDATTDDEIGYPLDPAEKPFKRQIRSLVEAIYRTLEDFRAAHSAAAKGLDRQEPVSERSGKAPEQAQSKLTVFLADTTDALSNLRRRVASELQQQGVNVAKQTPPPFEAVHHDEQARDEMERADLSVHLLDRLPGREIVDQSEHTYPWRQAELGLVHSRAQLIWTPPVLDSEAIEDEPYRRFLEGLENGPRKGANYNFIRESPTALTREIMAVLDRIKRPAKPPSAPSAALLDTHLKDQLHALELSRFLLERNVQPYINPEADDPSRNVKVLEERLKQVSRLIIVFGDVAEEWVRARLGEAVKIAIAEDCPLRACGIYFAPPRKKTGDVQFKLGFLPVYQFDSGDLADPRELVSLLFENGEEEKEVRWKQET